VPSSDGARLEWWTQSPDPRQPIRPFPAFFEQPNGNLTPQTTFEPARPAAPRVARASGIRIPAGTPVAVTLNHAMSTKTRECRRNLDRHGGGTGVPQWT
jgi:hypothetical protein